LDDSSLRFIAHMSQQQGIGFSIKSYTLSKVISLIGRWILKWRGGSFRKIAIMAVSMGGQVGFTQGTSFTTMGTSLAKPKFCRIQ
jgi:hypothetical protein